MKKTLTIITLAIGLLALAACGTEKNEEEIVVKTSKGNVTKEMLYEELIESPAADQVLTKLVQEVILENTFEVTDEDIDAEIEELKAQQGDQFDAQLEKDGITLDEYKKDIRKRLLIRALLTEERPIKDEEIDAFYDRLHYNLTVRLIMLDDKEIADEVKKKIDNGEDFGKLAEEYSIDSTAKNQGEISSFTAGNLIPEFEDVAFALEVGEASDLVEIDGDYYFIELVKKEDREDVGTLLENKNAIRANIMAQIFDQPFLEQKMKDLLEEANMEIEVDAFKHLLEIEEDSKPEDKPEDDKQSEDKPDDEADTPEDKE